MKKQLDDLMGRDRDLAPEDQRDSHWDDSDQCKYFLSGFCPNELFVNTKVDLGSCLNIHDSDLRNLYRTSSDYKRKGMEWTFLEYLESLQLDCDKRIRKNEARVNIENMEKLGRNVNEEDKIGAGGVDNIENNENVASFLSGGKSFQEGLDYIDKQIYDKFMESRTAGINGDMESALALFQEAENLKYEREKFYKSYGPKGPLLEVCKTCGSLLSKNEVEERVNDHIIGKQHMGYAKIRAKIKDLRDQVRQGKIRRDQY